MKRAGILLPLLLAGCATQFSVIDAATGHVGQGWLTMDQTVVITTGERAYYGQYQWNPPVGGSGRQLFLYGTARDDHTITCELPVDESFRGEGECRADERRYKVIFDR